MVNASSLHWHHHWVASIFSALGRALSRATFAPVGQLEKRQATAALERSFRALREACGRVHHPDCFHGRGAPLARRPLSPALDAGRPGAADALRLVLAGILAPSTVKLSFKSALESAET
jgi:hypothetical protein